MYEPFAAAYAEHAERSPYNAYYDRPAVLKLLGNVRGKRVLDAACGPGLYAAELLDRGADVVAFDASPTMIDLAIDRVGSQADLRVHDLAAPLRWLEDATFDLIVVALAINYVDERVAALRELRRVLKTSGALVLSTTHPTSDWVRLGGSYFSVERVQESLRRACDWPVRAWRRPLTAICDDFHAAGFLIERLLEPRPAAEMAKLYPEEFEQLEGAPAFIAFRLVPNPAADGRRPT